MFIRRFSVFAIALGMFASPACSAEIKIVGLAGMTPLMKELGPVFEAQSGHKIVPRYGSGDEGRRVIEAGDPFDIAVLNPPLMRMFAEQGKIASGTVRELFRNGTGVVVRAGARKPDVLTPDSFKAAILNAQSIAYSPGRASGIHVEKVLTQLGIADQVKSKIKPQPVPDVVAKAVASGEAEMGFAAMNLLVGISGAEVVGPFPKTLQEYIVFTLGLSISAQEPEAATALIKFLQSEAARSVMRRQGLQPY
ncbi:MAG: molybdate ABC transporter substrate-binding protein [Xanthobacteraceae bacterium]|nr:molybdate ABC transporter substrate-binding protein [Xanthobacteraceae bacterium]